MARLRDGWQTLVTIAAYPDLQFWEKEVTPPGIDGGGPNDTTTMRNEEWRTKQPKNLKSLTSMNMRVQYDPAMYEDAVEAVNDNVIIVVSFPDGALLTFWGWIDKFIPDPHKEGEPPTAMLTLECSNQDDDANEVAPEYTPPA